MQLQQVLDLLRQALADPVAHPGVAAIVLVAFVALILTIVLVIVAVALPGRDRSGDE